MGGSSDNRGLLEALLGDGRFLLSLTGVALFVSGAFAIFQAITGHFLPHDVHALGMDADALARATSPKVVQFMFHDRVAFGGVLMAIGSAYRWLVEFPLNAEAEWAWWALAISGTCGFLSFLAYLGYGYLDAWHGAATMALLPVFLAGLLRARPGSLASPWRRPKHVEHRYCTIARRLLLMCGVGLLTAGATILVVGMTFVFVPQDIVFMGISPERLRTLSPVLVPLIAHDRAGFGGGLFSIGLLLILIMRHARATRSLVELIAVMGLFGFGAALGVHMAVGYTDWTHLAPAYLGCALFGIGASYLAIGLRP